MVTNLPPQAVAQYKRVLESRTPEEKIRNLRIYLSLIPKHKGTERLQRQVKRQISELEEEIREKKSRQKRTKIRIFDVEEDLPLIVLIGRTLSGKSQILTRLTSARPRITGLPYTTISPEVGGFRSNSLVFQIVELPSLRPNSSIPPTHLDIIRKSDLVVLVIDLEQNLESQMNIIEELRHVGIYLGLSSRVVKIEKRDAGGISIIGESAYASRDEFLKALHAEKISAALVKVGPMSTLEDLKAAIRGLVVEPALILANKIDTARGKMMYENLVANYGGIYKVVGVSALTGEGFDKIEEAFLSTMGVIRIFTKPPSKEKPSDRPLLIRKGSTVKDLANTIHGELAKNLKYARIWRTSKKIEGLRVGPNFSLDDLDIVEIHG